MNTNDRAILLRYHEIALKGRNRGWFEERLALNARYMVRQALGRDAKVSFSRLQSRVIIHAAWSESTRLALGRVFGLSSFSPMRAVVTDKNVILKAAREEVDQFLATRPGAIPKTFRILTRRSDKALPETSPELDRDIGSAIQSDHPELGVSLKSPEFTLGVEIRDGHSYLWTEKFAARGGLPVGTNARVLGLMSGGIDSPVAALRALRRGSPMSFVHFYGAPFVEQSVLDKITELVGVINKFQPEPEPIHVIPFGKIQERIALATNPKLRTLIYRRMMIRIAERVAARVGAEALVTGESIGQVASQTVENLAAIDAVSTMPILRPLISFDKDEIIAEAERWGTFEISIRPGGDCCTLFADRHPAIRSSASILEEEEKKFPVAEIVEEALAGAQLTEI